MELLVKIGDLYNAERLIKIRSAHVSGVSYKTIKDEGLEYLKELSQECRVRVKTTINPMGFDEENWSKMGVITDQFAKKQLEIVNVYRQMGAECALTCTPYYGDNVPGFGDHIAWSESSAVIYANTVIGARTNRLSGPLALASAIIGKTPYYGLHIKENRVATVEVKVEIRDTKYEKRNMEIDYGILGYILGAKLKHRIPYFSNIRPTKDELKSLGAALGATGGVNMFHVKGITPEHKSAVKEKLEVIEVSQNEIQEKIDELTSNVKPELIAIGCPHCSYDELRDIAKTLERKSRKKTDIEFWVCTSRRVKKRAEKYVKIIEKFGKVLTDTCMVVTPIENRFQHTCVSSGKAAFYLPLKDFCSQRIIYAAYKTLIEKYL